MVMIEANIFEIKAKLSEYIDRAGRGDTVVIYRHNKAVAELRGIPGVRSTPRPLGPLPGRPSFKVPASFFDPLPEEELLLWEGAAPIAPSPARNRREGLKKRRSKAKPR